MLLCEAQYDAAQPSIVALFYSSCLFATTQSRMRSRKRWMLACVSMVHWCHASGCPVNGHLPFSASTACSAHHLIHELLLPNVTRHSSREQVPYDLHSLSCQAATMASLSGSPGRPDSADTIGAGF